MKRRIVMLLVVLMAAGVVNAELICHYSFDGNLNDSSVNNYPAGDGTLAGNTQYVAGKFGQALQFDGVQDYVQIMVAPSAQGGLSSWYPIYRVNQPRVSYAMWVYMDEYPMGDTDILAGRYWWPGDSNIEFHAFGFGYQTPFYIVAQQPGDLAEYCHKQIDSSLLGQWFHLAITYDVMDSNEGIMYINGVPGAVANLTSRSWIHIGNYTLGGNAGMDGRWFNGKIDELYIYNQVLSAADIATLMTGVDVAGTPGYATCGDAGYFAGDANRDCVVNFEDFAEMASAWLKCTNMGDEDCVVPNYTELMDYPKYENRN